MNGSATALVGSPREVDIAVIERELAELWKGAASSNGGSSPVLRACSLNLIVLSEKSSQLDEVAAMVGDVTVEHPGRVFLVETNRQAPEPVLESWISARCSLPLPGERQVCCEQITLVAAGEDVGKVPSVITSLLVPDVPTVLLWKAPLVKGGGLFGQLLKIADRVLIDSSEHCDPEDLLQPWGEFLATAEEHVSLCDLAWTHVVPWRALLANAFQPPETLTALHQISSLNVRYSSSTAPPHSGLSQALLLVSWLADRLSWSIGQPALRKSSGSTEAVFVSRQGPVAATIELVPPSDIGPGKIESLEFTAASGMKMAWNVMPGREAVEFRRELPGRAGEKQMIPFRNQTETVLIARELEVLQRDTVYEKSMAMLLNLLHGEGR